jgi:regulatory protein
MAAATSRPSNPSLPSGMPHRAIAADRGDPLIEPTTSPPALDGLQRALEVAYGYLNRRDRTTSEVRHRLARDGLDDAIVDEAIAALSEHGVLDDSRYARLFTQDKRELEQWGSERIRRALVERGVAREVVEQTLREELAESELDSALALLRRRFATAPRDRRERDRALGVMLRKGYDTELALDALAAFARDPGGDPGDECEPQDAWPD